MATSSTSEQMCSPHPENVQLTMEGSVPLQRRLFIWISPPGESPPLTHTERGGVEDKKRKGGERSI